MRKLFYILFALIIANMAYAQTVEFQVDMSIKTLKGTFNPSSDTMNLAGTFNNWTVGATQMAGPNADTVYTVTIDTFAVGDEIAFKFVINSTGWESVPDRQYTIPSGNSVYFAYYDNDSVFNPLPPQPISISFSCNMEFESVSGRFDPSQDTVTVRGTMNGWGSDDEMSTGLDPNIYEASVTDSLTVGDNVNYKFVYVHEGVINWESGGDRVYTITQDDYNNGFAIVPERTFNDLTLATITNAPCEVTFVTYMEGAIDANTGEPFPSIDNVVLCGANPPLHWPSSGWPNSDSTLVYFMYDDGTHGDVIAGDNYWSRTITFPIFSALDIEYKHGGNWGGTVLNDNEGGVGTNHHILLDPHAVEAMVIDTFGVNIGYHELESQTLGIKELSSAVPESYSLSQNYPNPFNPTTMIRFSLKEQGNVSLKVYNVIGQLVTTLVNEQKPAGTYEYNFDASNLSSGIYFYTIKAGDFTATRKMILMK